MMKTVLLVAVVTTVWCGPVSAQWTFTNNNPASNQSINRFASTVGTGVPPAAGATAKYSF